MCHLCKALDVEDVTARIGDGLAEEALRVGTEGSLDTPVVPVWVDEGTFDAQLLQCHAKEVECAAIDGVGGDEVVASLTDIEDSIEVGSLSAAGKHSAHTTLEGRNLLCYGIVGGVGQAGIKIAAVFEVEEACHLVARLIAERCTLVNRKLLRFALLGLPPAVYANGLEILFHIRIYNYLQFFVQMYYFLRERQGFELSFFHFLFVVGWCKEKMQKTLLIKEKA
jgi:hypothetical protein